VKEKHGSTYRSKKTIVNMRGEKKRIFPEKEKQSSEGKLDNERNGMYRDWASWSLLSWEEDSEESKSFVQEKKGQKAREKWEGEMVTMLFKPWRPKQ